MRINESKPWKSSLQSRCEIPSNKQKSDKINVIRRELLVNITLSNFKNNLLFGIYISICNKRISKQERWKIFAFCWAITLSKIIEWRENKWSLNESANDEKSQKQGEHITRWGNGR